MKADPNDPSFQAGMQLEQERAADKTDGARQRYHEAAARGRTDVQFGLGWLSSLRQRKRAAFASWSTPAAVVPLMKTRQE